MRALLDGPFPSSFYLAAPEERLALSSTACSSSHTSKASMVPQEKKSGRLARANDNIHAHIVAAATSHPRDKGA